MAQLHDSTTETERTEPRLWNTCLVWLPLFTGLVGLALLFVASELTDRKSLPGGLWWIGGALALAAVAALASLSLTRAY
jgi:integral membrane sensor domain MASE1